MALIIRSQAFFEDQKLRENDLLEIVQALQLECFQAGESVFEYGQTGAKFYIILSVKGSVNIPNLKIPEWGAKYKDYRQLLREIKEKEEEKNDRANQPLNQQKLIIGKSQ